MSSVHQVSGFRSMKTHPIHELMRAMQVLRNISLGAIQNPDDVAAYQLYAAEYLEAYIEGNSEKWLKDKEKKETDAIVQRVRNAMAEISNK